MKVRAGFVSNSSSSSFLLTMSESQFDSFVGRLTRAGFNDAIDEVKWDLDDDEVRWKLLDYMTPSTDGDSGLPESLSFDGHDENPATPEFDEKFSVWIKKVREKYPNGISFLEISHHVYQEFLDELRANSVAQGEG